MSETIVVTVLVENSVQAPGLMAEHGLAFHVQAGPMSFLFDTGQSGLVTQNARHLSVDLSRIRAIAVSHGHYDHTGGVRAVWDLAPEARLFAHPSVLVPRFARNPDGSAREVGLRDQNRDAIQAHAAKTSFTSKPAEVMSGFFLTGEILRETSYEDVGGPFVLDAAGTRPDPLRDDQALFFDTRDGVVVLLGCAHGGVVNTLGQVGRLTLGRPIHQVLGGMHLVNASPERLARTVAALRELRVERLGPAHCTGAVAMARLWGEFPAACSPCCVGSRFVFQR